MQNLSTPELLARIDALLFQAVGLGVDADRMRADALYARDVLLVCDGLPDSEGPALAQCFRTLRSPQDAARKEEAAAPRRPGLRAERRRDARHDRRRTRGKGRAPHGRERRRGPRRSVDSDTAPLAATGAKPLAGGSRIFNSIFGTTTQPPPDDVGPEQLGAAPDTEPRRRWFGRRPG